VQQPQAGLEIKAPVSWFLFTLHLFPLKLSINGSPAMPAKWGDNLIPMTPGRHVVRLWWMAYWFMPSNRGELTIDIAPGQVAQLEYKARWLVFLPGKLQQVGVRPMLNQSAPATAAQPAGWHPDPAARHELRYWNGSNWTDDVSDAGVAAKDAMA
jgi:hypothetical protein